MVGSYMSSLGKLCCMSFVHAEDQTRHAHQIRELSNVVGMCGFNRSSNVFHEVTGREYKCVFIYVRSQSCFKLQPAAFCSANHSSKRRWHSLKCGWRPVKQQHHRGSLRWASWGWPHSYVQFRTTQTGTLFQNPGRQVSKYLRERWFLANLARLVACTTKQETKFYENQKSRDQALKFHRERRVLS